jgi:sortase (surface protein transpeptidase)
VTRRERRELRRQEARRRRRERLRETVGPVALVAGMSLLVAGASMDPSSMHSEAEPGNGVPLASPATMAALAAGWQPREPVLASAERTAAEEVEAATEEAPETASAATEASVAPPVAVEIARIDVRSELIDLDLDEDLRLEVPTDPDLAGWYARGPRPGARGPAVIVGHVDSHRGPAVFHRLRELDAGDEIVVQRADGSEAQFIVQRLERWPKDDFPTDAVYREAAGAELRLITCGGVFDRRSRRYEDNIIVFAAPPSTCSSPGALGCDGRADRYQDAAAPS